MVYPPAGCRRSTIQVLSESDEATVTSLMQVTTNDAAIKPNHQLIQSAETQQL